MEVGIDVHDGVIAYLDALTFRILRSEHTCERGVVRSVVLREIACVGAELHAQHLSDAEGQIEVRVSGESGYGKNVLIGAGLVGQFAVPVQDAKFELLAEHGGEELNVAAVLAHAYAVAEGRDALVVDDRGAQGREVGIVL